MPLSTLKSGQGLVARHRILIVDCEESLSTALTLLESRGFDGKTVSGADQALATLENDAGSYQLILAHMAPGSEEEILFFIDRVARRWCHLPLIVVGADSSSEWAMQATEAGAFEAFTSPLPPAEELAEAFERASAAGRLQKCARELDEREVLPTLMGTSASMIRLYDTIKRIASSEANILLLGESGTGKELVAREIHKRSRRSSARFVAISCAAIPEALAESELFGHERGAFTGAHSGRAGAFERATGGTLLLDEVGELPPPVQAKLLRTLQEREIRRLGGADDIPVDVRIIAATNVDLQNALELGEFRADLYYRLSVVQVDLPPLRERHEDIVLLAAGFLRRFAQRDGREVLTLSPEAILTLEKHNWPGNVRELENVIQSAVALLPEGTTTIGKRELAEHFGARGRKGPDLSSPQAAVQDLSWCDGLNFSQARRLLQDTFEAAYLRDTLQKADGNVSAAARLAGIDRANLRRTLARHGLRAADFDRKK